MPLLVKDGVVFKEFPLDMMRMLIEIRGLSEELNLPMVVTSANDGVHMAGSLHYSNHALDLRTRHLSRLEAKAVLIHLRARLGPEYDVILEKDHIHCEFDPS